jgi:hypothetical protein
MHVILWVCLEEDARPTSNRYAGTLTVLCGIGRYLADLEVGGLSEYDDLIPDRGPMRLYARTRCEEGSTSASLGTT